MSDFRINVIIDPSQAVRGSRRVGSELDRVSQSADRLRGIIGRAFAFVGIGAGIRELVRLADTFTNIQNRARIVTNSTAQLAAVTDELFTISERTRVSFESTAALYNRTALATKDLGLTQRETLQFTESLNQAIILSGASAKEASAGLIQLSQGLASGVLRGDELRSVLEQLPAVADVISAQIGVTRGELRLLGEQGRISAEQIIKAFQSASGRLNKDFGTTSVTIGQSLVVLQTNFIKFIAEVDKATGITSKLAQLILDLARNLDNVAAAAAAAAAALAANFVRNGVNLAIVAVRALTVAIAANPIGLIAVGIAAAVAAFTVLQDEVRITVKGLATFSDLIDESFSTFGPIIERATSSIIEFGRSVINALGPIADFLEPLFNRFNEFFSGIEVSLGGFLRLTARILDRIISVWLGAFNAIVAVFKTFPDRIGSFFVEAANAITKEVERITNTVIASLNVSSAITGIPLIDFINFDDFENNFKQNLGSIGNIASEAFTNSFTNNAEKSVNAFLARVEQRAQQRLSKIQRPVADAGLDDRPERIDRIPAALKEQLRLLAQEAQILQLSNRERKVQTELLAIEEKLRNQNTILTASQRELLRSAIELTQAYRIQAEVLESITGPQDELAQNQEALNALLNRGAISANQFGNALMDLRLEQAELNIQLGESSFIDGFLLGIEQMLEAVRNFSSEAGMIFGDFFSATTEGFGQAAADAIVFGESFEDAIGNVARRVLADLIASFVQLGAQYLLNQSLQESLTSTQLTGIASVQGATIASQAATTASSIAASQATTTTIVADNAAIAASAAPAAALESTATFGGAAVAGLAALAAILAFSQNAFADGGIVRGAGGPRSDSIPAMLSNGEFVVNARSTSRFKPLLEQINNPRGFQNGGFATPEATANTSSISSDQPSQQQGNVRIVNNFDPNLFEDFVTSPNGERVILNMLERNTSSINQFLRNS